MIDRSVLFTLIIIIANLCNLSCKTSFPKSATKNAQNESVISDFELPHSIDSDTFKLSDLDSSCVKMLIYLKSHIRNDGDSLVILFPSKLREDTIVVMNKIRELFRLNDLKCFVGKLSKEDIIYILGKPQIESDIEFKYQLMSRCCVPNIGSKVQSYCFFFQFIFDKNKVLEVSHIFPSNTFPPRPLNCDLWKISN